MTKRGSKFHSRKRLSIRLNFTKRLSKRGHLAPFFIGNFCYLESMDTRRPVLILASLLFLAGCATTKTDPYEAVCGPSAGYFFANPEDVPASIADDYLETVPIDALECRAEAGDFYAQYNLGRLHLEGKRVDLDFQKAATLFLQAGMTRDEQNQFRLRQIGVTSFGSSENRVTQGFPPAQYALGLMFYSGLHTKKDEEEALKWISKAATLGNPEARVFLERLEAQTP